MPAEESIENSVPKIISLWCLDSEGTETVLNIPVDSTDLNPVIQFEEIFTDLCNNTENLLPEGDALENINENIVSIEFDTYKIWIEWSLLDSAYLSTQYRMTEPAAYMEIHQSEPGIDKYFILSLESVLQKILLTIQKFPKKIKRCSLHYEHFFSLKLVLFQPI